MQLEQRIVKPITNPASLQDSIRVAIALAKHLEQPIILSYAQAWRHIDPLAFLAAKSEVGQHKFYWQQPEQGLTLAAGGMVASISEKAITSVQPTLRFDVARRFAQRYLTHAVVGGEPNLVKQGALVGPYVLGGFAFHDVQEQSGGITQVDRIATGATHQKYHPWFGFPAVMMFVPRWLMRQTDGDLPSTLTVNHCVYPHDDPEAIELCLQQLIAYLSKDFKEVLPSTVPSQSIGEPQTPSPPVSIEEIVGDRPWAEIVQQAVDCIKLGKLDKVVLSRALEVTARHNYNSVEVLDRLRQSYPECIAFLIDLGMGTAFLGATPELLLKFQTCNNSLLLSSEAVAGSIGRSSSFDLDDRLGDRLLHSHKDRNEHEIVIDSICNCLQRVGAVLHEIEPPKLLKLSNVQHLYTPIAAELSNTSWLTAFDVLKQLHPTAAVGGDPKALALHLMREWEICDRGWYAAPIGWVNGNGEGAFAVGIRSGYLRDNKARIYAGAGIVSDSQFDAEFDETAIKFEALLQALGATQD
jgi:menaquinone-specific isochorismate synthase